MFPPVIIVVNCNMKVQVDVTDRVYGYIFAIIKDNLDYTAWERVTCPLPFMGERSSVSSLLLKCFT